MLGCWKSEQLVEDWMRFSVTFVDPDFWSGCDVVAGNRRE
jgi:hypothetical protein